MYLNCSVFLDTRCAKIPKEYSEAVNRVTRLTKTNSIKNTGCINVVQKNLKIPKGLSEVEDRRTDNAIATRKKDKRWSKIHKTET